VKPVGYHVTVPCHTDDAGYRTFDSMFAVERSGGSGLVDVVKLVHVEKMLRDKQAVHSEYGGAGFCRKGNYGMPMAITNTMRMCTADSLGAQYDATVPVRPKYGNASAGDAIPYEEEVQCASSPFETPWFAPDLDELDTEMQAVGSVPMWSTNPDSGDSQYPKSDNSRDIPNTLAGFSEAGWGEVCHEGTLLTCSDEDPCVPLEGVHDVLQCIRGVCVRKISETDTCYSHADCLVGGTMCSGDGFCVDPVYQVQNERPGNIEFQLYADEGTCQDIIPDAGVARSYDTYGASPWETMPDVLHTHGLCSYRNWFEMQRFPNSSDSLSCQAADAVQGQCRTGVDWHIDSRLHDTAAPPSQVDFKTLWESGRYRMDAHACDMDYTYVRGLRGCSPHIDKPGALLDIVGTTTRRSAYAGTSMRRNKLMRSITRAGKNKKN
jgi:hypothetical protein